jgi:hypothetical protein
VEVFERDGRAGGHSNTVMHDGLALDTGFLVHNVPNYPLLCRLFAELGVATLESNMSFSVSCAGVASSGRGGDPSPSRATLGVHASLCCCGRLRAGCAVPQRHWKGSMNANR